MEQTTMSIPIHTPVYIKPEYQSPGNHLIKWQTVSCVDADGRVDIQPKYLKTKPIYTVYVSWLKAAYE